MTGRIPPIFIVHYTGYPQRRRYLEMQFSRYALPEPEYITEQAFEKASLDYKYDEAQYRKNIEPIRDILVAHLIGLTTRPDATWGECFELYRGLGTTLDDEFSLFPPTRPRPLTPAGVSIVLQHRAAWKKIAEGDSDVGIVAEDDVFFSEGAAERLRRVLADMPRDFDYVDLAGGCGLFPRADSRAVNGIFYEAVPPRTRTCCCAIISRTFARRLVELDPPVCLPIDHALTSALRTLQAKVYWVHPLVFLQGSELAA